MGKVRRSGRIAKQIRILLLGMDCTGTVFSEETQTVTLSRHGAGIISKHKLATDGLLIMRFLGGSTETAIRLVGQLGQDARGFVYGVAFVDEQEDFWELKFPPPQAWNVEVDGPMQCESCKRCEVVDQSEVEADVYCAVGVDFALLHLLRDADGVAPGAGRNRDARGEAATGCGNCCRELSAKPYTCTRAEDG